MLFRSSNQTGGINMRLGGPIRGKWRIPNGKDKSDLFLYSEL
jgi:hypothetical protein